MNNQISKKQFFTLLSTFLMGNSLAIAGGLSKGEKIGYITIFASFLLYIGLAFMYGIIFKKSKDADLFLISENLLGKFFYKIMLFMIFIYSFLTALITSTEFLFFIELSSDFSLNPLWTALVFSISLYAIFLCGKKALARYSEVILPFVLFILLFIIVSGYSKMNVSNLKIDKIPSASYILSSTLTNFLSPFSNILLVLFFSSGMLKGKNIKSASIKAGILALIVISGIYAINLLVLGKELMGELYFPTLYTFGVINPNLFTERSETMFFVTYIFFDVLYTAVSYFTAMSCFKRLFFKKNTFSKKFKKVFLIIPALCSFIVMNLKTDITVFHESLPYIPYIFAIVTVGLPAILTVISLRNS